MKVFVLYGGDSEERTVSLRSGERVVAALRQKGHTVQGVDARGESPCADLLAKCRAADAVFLCFHGGSGEDGRWQGALETAGVHHYTGSDARASAIAMDKPQAKACVSAGGVPVASGCCRRKEEGMPNIAFPFAVKPPKGGSSIGFSVIRSLQGWQNLTPSGD